MSGRAPLLMIPGPIEVSPAVREAAGGAPPSHVAPALIEAFGRSLEQMRRVWQAGPASQPFVVAGAGTVAMDMAVSNLIEPGERVVVVNTGYFSDRIAEMLRRAGAEVIAIEAAVGDAPPIAEVERAVEQHAAAGHFKALVATHVDTSTAVRVDPAPLAALAREHGMLSIFDGVCATGAEPFDMEGWGADVYLTASQKAIGLPPGLGLLVASERALETRRARGGSPPPMYLDWASWLPIMRAYEERRPSYFSTPATNLILALDVGLGEILHDGIPARFALHRRAGRAMRAAWRALGLELVPVREDLAADTLSAIRFPHGVDASLVGRILQHGVIVAGGLHPAIRSSYFRVGHMGYSVTAAEPLRRTVAAVGAALRDSGSPVDADAAVAELSAALSGTAAD